MPEGERSVEGLAVEGARAPFVDDQVDRVLLRFCELGRRLDGDDRPVDSGLGDAGAGRHREDIEVGPLAGLYRGREYGDGLDRARLLPFRRPRDTREELVGRRRGNQRVALRAVNVSQLCVE